MADSIVNVQDPEQVAQQTVFMKWNTKPTPEYKLQFYNYFSEFLDNHIQIYFYNRINTYYIPKIKHYIRYAQSIFPEQIQANKNSQYNTLMTDANNSDIVVPPYKGRYSLQPDYHFFRR